MSTGIASLDAITDGLEPGDFFLVASRPSMGKSALCLQIAAHVAASENRPVAIFSYGDSVNGLAARIVRNRERISGDALREGTTESWDKFHVGIENVKPLQLYFDAPCQLALEKLVVCCEDLRACLPYLALILVDDVQGMMEQADEECDGEEISQAFKSLAKATGTCIIAATQTSRSVERRTDKRPILKDLRDFGALDLHADVVCGLYRDEYYDLQTQHRGLAELRILKNEKGPKGTLEQRYNGSGCRFESVNG